MFAVCIGAGYVVMVETAHFLKSAMVSFKKPLVADQSVLHFDELPGPISHLGCFPPGAPGIILISLCHWLVILELVH